MRLPTRRSDDDDIIRARLRALLAETRRTGGWVPPDEELCSPPDDEPDDIDGDPDGGLDHDSGPGAGDRDSGVPARDGAGAAVADREERDGPQDGLGRHRAPGPTVRLDPGRPGAWALWLVGVVAAAAVAGWTWMDRPTVEPAPVPEVAQSTSAPEPSGRTPTAPATPTGTVVVSVVGQVGAPGLVTLPAGARVADALAAAGGLLPEADPAALNAAALLTDGEQVAVGVPAVVPPAAAAGAGTAGGGLLDLNRATAAELDALPGIGPVLAQRIVDHRTAHGPFTSDICADRHAWATFIPLALQSSGRRASPRIKSRGADVPGGDVA